MRTFSRADWNAAQDAWRDGDFSDEWKQVRHQAALRGMVYPPVGTRWDSWEDDEPSQRAMLIRAIRETPKLLSLAISRSKSWGDVIAYVNARRDEWRVELNRDIDFQRDDPTRHQPMTTIAGMFDQVAESLGYVRAVVAEPEEPA